MLLKCSSLTRLLLHNNDLQFVPDLAPLSSIKVWHRCMIGLSTWQEVNVRGNPALRGPALYKPSPPSLYYGIDFAAARAPSLKRIRTLGTTVQFTY